MAIIAADGAEAAAMAYGEVFRVETAEVVLRWQAGASQRPPVGQGCTGAGACGTGGTTRGATPQAWRADRRASGAQPAAVMGRGAGCAFAVVSSLRWTGSTPLTGRCRGDEAAIAPPLRRCSPWKRFGRAALDPYLRSRALGTGPPDSIDGETGKAEQRIQYWGASGAGARVSGPGAQDRELQLTGSCTEP